MSLFRKSPTRSETSTDVNHAILYSYTIHPHKYCKFNRKNYGNYNSDQQVVLLTKMEMEFRIKHPSIKLVELHYEIAPNTGNIHLHGLYSMPPIFESTVKNYFDKILNVNNEKTKVPWRHLDLTKTRNREDWLKYIRKDQPTQLKP